MPLVFLLQARAPLHLNSFVHVESVVCSVVCISAEATAVEREVRRGDAVAAATPATTTAAATPSAVFPSLSFFFFLYPAQVGMIHAVMLQYAHTHFAQSSSSPYKGRRSATF